MDFLALQSTLRPNNLAISDLTSKRKWTYAQLHELVSRTVVWFQENNVKEGQRVACIAKNCAEIVVLSLACGRAGVMLVPINWRLSSTEIQTLLQDCQPSLIFSDELGDELNVEHITISNLPQMVASCPVLPMSYENDTKPSLILYTSGTTGVPKGVMHSEASIMETTLNMGLLAYVDSESVFLCEAPMFHVIGLISSIRPALYHGGAVLISDGFIPERTLDRMMEPSNAVTHYFCVPQMANVLRQQPNFAPEKLTNLKAILTGGAPHPAVHIRRWLKDNIPIVDGYGMSEAGTIFHMPFDIETINAKAGLVGVPGHRIKARIADSEGKALAMGNTGEIQVKGEGLFLGIWNKPELFTQCFTADGWFKTGDVGIQDEDGFYRIVDRIKDMFISGGENVYPVEVEAVALTDPQVLECALVGMEDEKWGEVGCLFVVPDSDIEPFDEDVLLNTLTHSLARYKIPKKIEVVNELPRNSAGKVIKNTLRAQLR